MWPLSSSGSGNTTTSWPSPCSAAETVRLAFVIVSAKLTSVGGTSKCSNVPLMLSLPPMAGRPSPSCAANAPKSAPAGFPQRVGSSVMRSKYSWNVSRAFIASAPIAVSFDRLSTTAHTAP